MNRKGMLCSEPDCHLPVHATGLCQKHYSAQNYLKLKEDNAARRVRNTQIDGDMMKFLDGVSGVVEATGFENLCLWQRHRDQRVWKENLSGFLQTVGLVWNMPVCIKLNTAEIDGRKLLFFHPTSQMIDYRLIDDWFKNALPRTAYREDGVLNRTDAMNFHTLLPMQVDA